MTTSVTSSLEEINAVLHDHNPFAQPPYVNANNVWGKGFPDVEFLNAHASDAVFRALEEIRLGHYSTTSILITAQDGTGKTHIISRIRHRLQAQGGALFVFANKFNDLNQIKQGFQQILAESLSNIGSQGVKQWQELAAAMANDALKFVSADAKPIAAKDFVKRIETIDDEDKVQRWINQLTKAFCKTRSVQDPDIVRAIFWTLSDDEAAFASNWLAGKALAQFKANDLRLPDQKQSFDATLQILALISEYNELVICFDELDVLDFDDRGLHKSQIVASLVKELFENLKRGVILSVLMPGTWTDRIKKELPGGVSQKMTTQGNPYDLRYMDGDSALELVAFFLKEFYESRSLCPPHQVYPFDEGAIRAIGREKPTVREVLQWCRENCKPTAEIDEDLSVDNGKKSSVLLISETDPVEMAFINELDEDIINSLDDNYLLAEALLLGFQTIIGETVEGVTLEEVTTGVGKKGKRDDYLNFKILGEEAGYIVSIGVAVLQYDGGRALGAGLRRLVDEEERFDLTRGCLVRSKNKPINNYFISTYLNPLIEEGGEFVELNEKEIKPLIALRSVYQKRGSDYKITEEDITNFISKYGAKYWLGIHNPLLKEILSDPSYQIPEGIEDEPESLPENVANDLDSTETEDLQELIHV
ncbi:MAG: ATP-binding protein [Oscillatoriophycideae cyanobacterium NC_groundwater_1537_Pr4_S-0.65um_50_18]|nr:ATP-binding protein [Oscillatoriophycideae cyanobacterium NC_groundwater_1537_Pr4_S-0.65um_50_18]